MSLTDHPRQWTKALGDQVTWLFIHLPKGRQEVKVTCKQALRSSTAVPSHTRKASRARSDAEPRAKWKVRLPRGR